MASTNDSNLNRVDLSLYEFLGAQWQNPPRAKSNPNALEMLLRPNEKLSEETKTRQEEEDSLVPDRPNETMNKTESPPQSRITTLQKHHYFHVLKCTYPSVWYVARQTYAITGAGIQRVKQLIYVGYYFGDTVLGGIMSLIAYLTKPLQFLFDLFVGDEYERAQRLVRGRIHRNRLWLGRSRGHNYMTAFYQRCLYFFSYFKVHQFYQVDQFLRSSLTIRRGLQTILPIAFLCSTTRERMVAPSVGNSFEIAKQSPKIFGQGRGSISQLLFFEQNGEIFEEGFYRTKDDVTSTMEPYLTIEFVGGEYAEVEKEFVIDVRHPTEAFTTTIIGVRDQNGRAQLWEPPVMSHLGFRERSLAQMEQVPSREEREEDDTDKSEEEIEVEEENFLASFVYEPEYLEVRADDAALIQTYTQMQRVRKYRTAYKQFLRIKTFLKERMTEKTFLEANQNEAKQQAFTKKDTKRRKIYKKNLRLLELNMETRDSAVFDESEFDYIDALPYIPKTNFPTFKQYVEEKAVQKRHLTFSPLGIVFKEKPEPSILHSTDEIKTCQYAFDDSFSLLQNLQLYTAEEEKIDFAYWQITDTTDWPDSIIKKDEFSEELSDQIDEHYCDEEDDIDEDDDIESDDNIDGDDDIESDDNIDGGGAQKSTNESLNSHFRNPPPTTKADNLWPEEIAVEHDWVKKGEIESEADTTTEWKEGENELGPDKWDEYLDKPDPREEQEEVFEDASQNDQTQLMVNHLYSGEDAAIGLKVAQLERLCLSSTTTFINPGESELWSSKAWKTVISPLLMYGAIELCIRLECRGAYLEFGKPPFVNRFIARIYRMPEAVYLSEYVGETLFTVRMSKLLLAFKAKRGANLYGQSEWTKAWNRLILQNISEKQGLWLDFKLLQLKKSMQQLLNPSTETVPKHMIRSRKVLQSMNLPKTRHVDIGPRYFQFDKWTHSLQQHVGSKMNDGASVTANVLVERQTQVNRLGGEITLKRGFDFGKAVQEEICQFPLFALIKPGEYKMDDLSKGLILLGEYGNGRTYFVRTLATESRLPLLVTESNRYLDPAFGALRLKTLFRRARRQAPNILFIRDMDFMSRHRERYPMFASVRATTQLLMGMDGYTKGTETVPIKQDIFVVGSMKTTSMMDGACMRSGRFEWVLHFYYPAVKERRKMFLLHSTKSIVNTTVNVDWHYFAAMTEGFSSLDIRMMLNSSAMYALTKGNPSLHHTNESVAFALGATNQVHDIPETAFVLPRNISFFLRGEYRQRHGQMTQYAPFFTQTGHVPMYKKLMHLFHVMVADETETLASRWALTSGLEKEEGILNPPDDLDVINGLLPLLCEGLFLYNTQKMCSAPYPIVTFDTYCAPLFSKIKHMVNLLNYQYTLERTMKEHVFITSFDRWERAHSNDWMPTGLFNGKSIAMRTNATNVWRSTRLSKKHSIIEALSEVETETLWGPPQIATKIRNRLTFIGEKQGEYVSRDATLFGTFETHSDLAFKCRKKTTARRVNQVSMEILDVMQKHWRKNIPPQISYPS